jgi:D-alanyl-D-alanine carboxypeptidase/D-alanyl-D-alanine-endopeptidase (penicillin-binding protein 4)
MHKLFLIFFLPIAVHAQLDTFSRAWRNDKALKSAAIGFCVMEAGSEKLISQYNSQQFLIPASTLKIITTYAALNLLGVDYRYETKLSYTGTFDKQTGILNGDLIISGSGDPTLQSENFPGEPVTDSWAKVLKEKGIKEIKGKIIGDGSYFDKTVPGNWLWEDVSNYFGAVPCGLSFMDNKFKIFLNSGETGSPAKVTGTSLSYQTHTVTFNSKIISRGIEDQAYVYGDPFSWSREIKGSIPPNKTNYEIEAALPDPALLCAESLCASLKKAGVKCESGSAVSNYKKENISAAKQLLYTHFSPTLDKIIYFTNQQSNNHYCESVVKTIGSGNTESGLSQVKKFCLKKGLDTTEVFMADGCGLARVNTMTTFAQASWLCKVFNDSTNYGVFENSLPVAGKQGSMSNLGKGTSIENNMHAKTGYMQRVRAYCGYVKNKSGNVLAFSVIFNNYNCTPKEAKLKIEKFLVALSNTE